ncbi:SpoIIE family protein phosphatase [Flintibacter muris]|uniref:SpoIIE family protein phosphatase n=1 Tax=Flintibacter muris TaxID=2941327 RepID=UPI00203B524F|nr:SpoIIE family protein phosphatase [Flintibacter muris]
MTARTIYSKLSGLRGQSKSAEPMRTQVSPLAVLAEAGIHLLLAAVLGGAVVFGNRAPLGVAFVAAAGSGLFGGASLVGACFGALTALDFSTGLRYASAAILTFAIHFAFYDWKLLRRPWSMPIVAGGLTAFTGFIVQSQTGWRTVNAVYLVLETALVGAAAWAFRGALAPMARRRRDRPSAAARRVGPLALLCACLTAIAPMEIFGIPMLAVAGVGACALALFVPDKVLGWLGVWSVPETAADIRAQRLVQQKLERTAQAFRTLCDSLRSAFRGPDNDNDVATVFDRAAGRQCRACTLRDHCWKTDYNTTFNALNDATPAMVERGRAEKGDFPRHFADRCIHFPDFVAAVNEELTALFYRRQYNARIRESRAAVCRQYAQLSDLLGEAAAELSRELTPDVIGDRRLRQRLSEWKLDVRAAVYQDGRGLLRVEAEGPQCAALARPSRLKDLSAVLGVPLRVELEGEEAISLIQQEPLMAVAGVAARKKTGETVSGDAGTYFKRHDGKLYLLLCDGMGSGPEANRESTLAVRLLEQLLQAGVEAPRALTTLASALALRGEETGGFTTVDLLQLDLFTGEGELFKLGAAPTYIKKSGEVQRLSGKSLPAGLAEGEPAALDRFSLRLAPGDCVLMISDGVCPGPEDGWLRERLARFSGESPKDLARELVTRDLKEATDDRTALVIRVDRRTQKDQAERAKS